MTTAPMYGTRTERPTKRLINIANGRPKRVNVMETDWTINPTITQLDILVPKRTYTPPREVP